MLTGAYTRRLPEDVNYLPFGTNLILLSCIKVVNIKNRFCVNSARMFIAVD